MELRLKELCTLKGTTQKELAEKLDVTEMTLSRASKGNTSMQLLERIAKELGVEIWEMFTESTEKEGTIGIIRHNGKPYEINSLDDIKKLFAEIEDNKS